MKILSLICALTLLPIGFCRADFGSEVQSYNFGTADIVTDTTRDRVYCAVPAQNSVAVIDSESLAVIATIFTGSQPNGLDVSADGASLAVAHLGTNAPGVAVIDLETLTVSKSITTVQVVRDVCIGNGTIYTLESGAIRAYSVSTGNQIAGEITNATAGVFVYGGILEISPDNNTLYYYHTGLSPSSWFRINVTSWPGSVIQQGQFGSSGNDMALSADGAYISFASGAPYYVNKFDANNPTISLGQMSTGAYPRAVTFSPNGNYIFAVHTSGHIDVWNANTYVQLTPITTVGEPRNLECDRKGKVCFAGTTTTLKAYYIGVDNPDAPTDVSINQAVEIRWSSVSGSLYQVEWATNAGANTNWFSIGGPVLGNGLTMSVFETTRDNRAKFFRVRKLSE